MLNVQYRMHPYISRFPNEAFYDGAIINGNEEAIKSLGCIGIYLGHIFGNYSFIDIKDGMEQHIGQSVQNELEAALAANIVSRLSEGIVR
jgi:senataxin